MKTHQEQSFDSKFDWKLWKDILGFTVNYKREMAILAVIMLLVGGIDAIFPILTRHVIDNFVIPQKLEGLSTFGLYYGLLVIIQAVNIWLLITFAGKVEMGIGYDIRKLGFRRLQELSLSYYDRTAVGWLMARMTSDIRRLSSIISWGLVDLVWGVTMMLFIVVIMVSINWRLALIALSVVPPLVVISLYFQKKILHSYRNVRKTNSRITGAFNEGIMGAQTSKTLVREAENLNEFTKLTGEMRYTSVRAAILSSLFLPIVLTLSSIGTALVLWSGGNGVMMGVITYGTVVAFISYIVRFFEPVRELARIFAELQLAQASAERVLSMIRTEPEIKDSQAVHEKYGDTLELNKGELPEIIGNITFQDVSFTYQGGEQVLENFNLEVRAGETIALVGETGAGKSTIVNLTCRFYEPTAGNILIDGVDYRERPLLWLHRHLGYVLQSPHLFSGTIRENIRYGRLAASDQEVIQAAQTVNADHFITALEKGYDTEVGEGGSKLSTGQKQLISFARAILADPKILVLDEATSSIDTELEQLIQQAISILLEGRTSFIIAHRLSTIRSADRILVIQDGRITEEGNHQQLLKEKGYYYRLYTNQFAQV
ncbi:MAG: ABC transporter ATP-binding protein/permease [Halanaerobiales bacterium]|nr:ABC transporter ATP-binding protein/permease [Halanaerobiales bacterium]